MKMKKDIPDDDKPLKPSWRVRLIRAALRSPVCSILIIAFFYFALKAFVLNISPEVNKLYMFGVVCLWLFWYLARSIFKMIFILILIVFCFYTYHTYSSREIAQCEASGGVWNEQTGKCQEKEGFWVGIFKRFHDLSVYSKDKD